MGTPPACDFNDAPMVIEARNTTAEAEMNAVYQCAKCGHGVTFPPLADVSVLYEGRASQDYQRVDRSIAERIKAVAFRRQARSLLKKLACRPRTVVDFGCGSGLFTSCIAEELPPQSTVIALDFFDEPPRDMGRVIYKSFAHLPDLEGSADVLLCFHALEHDNDPDTFLERLLLLLSDDGLLVLEVPNIDCFWGKFFGRNWDNWYLPYHRVHFSGTSLKRLFERHELEIVQEAKVCNPSFGRTFARIAGTTNTFPFMLLGIIMHPVQWLGEFVSDRPSALRVIVKRRRS
jgi:ubiquinone/menaquinone biosynthesis C-methylase UbiE